MTSSLTHFLIALLLYGIWSAARFASALSPQLLSCHIVATMAALAWPIPLWCNAALNGDDARRGEDVLHPVSLFTTVLLCVIMLFPWGLPSDEVCP